jgi:C-terminal processing protease CtpA/Prc
MNKKKFLISIFLSVITLSACRHTTNDGSGFNLDFEDVENGMPRNWSALSTQSDYTVSSDSVTVKSGKYSMVIEFTGNAANLQGIQFVLPDNYNGEKITLSGYIKTENVSEGFAGLWMRLDPKMPFDYKLQHEITGTTDWKKYEITLDIYPEETRQILVGGLLYGKGKVWLDDFKVEIDGKDIGRAKPYTPKPFPAGNDKEFEKGSAIEFPELNEQKIENLELLGRIWGFLKYHHPVIAKGKYNWDNELFRILPAYLNVNDSQQRDKLLIRWIHKYGSIPKCKECTATPDTAFIKPDISWIEHSNISRKLKKTLQHIYLNRNQGKHYYIYTMPIAWNPVFIHEIDYKGSENPDAGLRLLALYRYWNMIHYFFPSKYLTGKDWNGVLKEYIPCFIKAPDRLEYELTASMLIGEICDTHAFLQGFEEIELARGNKQVPVHVRFIENRLVITERYTGDVPLKIGDVITHIDGKPVEDIVDSVKKYYPASNEVARLRNIAGDLLRSNKLSIHIDYLSSEVMEQKEIYLGARSQMAYYLKINEDTAKCYRFIDEDIGYITLKNIKEEDISVIKEKFMNTKGIIIDIRNYPSIYSIRHRLAPCFVRMTTPFARFMTGNLDNPGAFSFDEEYNIIRSESDAVYQGKLAVLVNEYTQSHAEFVTMAFQAGDNTTVIGSQTAGADGNMAEIVLPGGLKTAISGIGIYYPDGRETQRIGIVPDIKVKPTIRGIREGRDELLEKAIEFIRQKSDY